MSKRSIFYLRCLGSLCFLSLLFLLLEPQKSEPLSSSNTPALYSNNANDNLEDVFLHALQGAKESILLIVYSLSDTKIIEALQKQANTGVQVKVFYDSSNGSPALQQLSHEFELKKIKVTGLMHKKILVVDGERVWIGSANFTRESLKLHDNLVIGLIDRDLAQSIEKGISYRLLTAGDQVIEFWSLPEMKKEGLKRILEVIDGAKKSIRVAMFTWTHPVLTEAIIRAHKRGVNIEVILDKTQAQAVSLRALHALTQAGVQIRLSSGFGLLHHKFAWIDKELLINGSTNWTAAAFSRNSDCFLIVHSLTKVQNSKLEKIWKKLHVFSTPKDDIVD